jgi:hypothetical protein
MKTMTTVLLAGAMLASTAFAGVSNRWVAERFQAKMGRALPEQKAKPAAAANEGHGCCRHMQEACCR